MKNSETCEVFEEFAPVDFKCYKIREPIEKEPKTEQELIELRKKQNKANRKYLETHPDVKYKILEKKKHNYRIKHSDNILFGKWFSFWNNIERPFDMKSLRLFRRFWFHIENPEKDFLKELHREAVRKFRRKNPITKNGECD